jgi:hypothetical protein
MIETAPDKYAVDALYERYEEDFYRDPGTEDSDPMEKEVWRESPEGRAAIEKYEAVRALALTRAEQVRGLFRDLGAENIDGISEDGNASGGFTDGCDSYQGFAFSAHIGGRHYYITVEDVTIREDA